MKTADEARELVEAFVKAKQVAELSVCYDTIKKAAELGKYETKFIFKYDENVATIVEGGFEIELLNKTPNNGEYENVYNIRWKK